MRIATLHPARVPIGKTFVFTVMVFLLYSIFAVGHLLEKPGLAPGVGSGTDITYPFRLDGVEVRTGDELEFIVSGYRIGDEVTIDRETPGSGPVVMTLGRYYRPWSISFDAVIAIMILGVGVIVMRFHTDRGVARVFMGATLVLGAALLGTKTIYVRQPAWLGMSLCVLFFGAYTTISVFFLHFTSVFPVRRMPWPRVLTWVLYPGALLMAAWQARLYLDAAGTHSILRFRDAASASVWMNGFVVAGILTGLVLLVGSYRRAGTLSERKKTAWILYGLTVGTLPFALFWALPQVFNADPVIPEIVFKVFLLAIPVSFAIAILQYRLVDITTLISRSAVHAIVIGTLLVLYALLFGVTAGLVSGWTVERSILLSAAAAVVSVVTYDWIRRRAERLVDRSLFRLSYDFRGSLKEVLEDLKKSAGMEEMTEKLIGGVGKLLPVERIGLFSLVQPGNRLRTLGERNFPHLSTHGVHFEAERLKSGLELPVAVDEHIEKNVPHENADTEVFGRWGISLAIPMKSKGGAILGFLVLGRKTSGLMFTEEDVDLLTVVAGEAAGEKERIDLQRFLEMEKAEAERLEELNRLKSYFVSSVSHELKTPLTSISMFAQLLRSKKDIPDETVSRYLTIIEGESERLTRLINNVLDFAKIERGVKEYHFRETSLNDIVTRLGEIMEYQFRIKKCETVYDLADDPLILAADPDAILEVLLNLAGNALKYSGEPKRISITTRADGGNVAVSVGDNGFGIDPAEVEEIFRPFHRSKDARAGSQGGAGLGLSVVKHVVDAHRGTITVNSEPGRGSTFTVTLPVEPSSENREERS